MPLIEYLESLHAGSEDLDIQTFKLTDQLSGRMMGVRADMTPQVARIDAHRMKMNGQPNRLCYMGTVLKTRPDNFAGSRSPLQIGAELYGHNGIDSDFEILSLMLETFNLCNMPVPIHIDIGHVGIFREISRDAQLDQNQEAKLFDMLQRKAQPEIKQWLDQLGLNRTIKDGLINLSTLHGGREVLVKAREMPAFASRVYQRYFADLNTLSKQIQQQFQDVEINFDFAELRGFHYETGIVFAAYRPGEGRELARGGRYDGIGRRFGHARPATGFSADLKNLLRLADSSQPEQVERIYAPAETDAELRDKIRQLRNQGSIVIQSLTGQQVSAKDMGCTAELLKQNGRWVVNQIR